MNYVARIKEHEGLNLTMYTDTQGKPTIGFGHNLREPISKENAQDIFDTDMFRAEVAATDIIQTNTLIELPNTIKGIIIEMCFVLGKNGTLRFVKFIEALKAVNYEEAAKELRDSEWHDEASYRVDTLAAILEQQT